MNNTSISIKHDSCYKNGSYHIGRKNLWGNYCPDTEEYYLAHDAGEYIGLLASGVYAPDGSWLEQSERGYTYEVVRELLQLGHLTKNTLKGFIAEGGDVWWDQP